MHCRFGGYMPCVSCIRESYYTHYIHPQIPEPIISPRASPAEFLALAFEMAWPGVSKGPASHACKASQGRNSMHVYSHGVAGKPHPLKLGGLRIYPDENIYDCRSDLPHTVDLCCTRYLSNIANSQDVYCLGAHGWKAAVTLCVARRTQHLLTSSKAMVKIIRQSPGIDHDNEQPIYFLKNQLT